MVLKGRLTHAGAKLTRGGSATHRRCALLDGCFIFDFKFCLREWGSVLGMLGVGRLGKDGWELGVDCRWISMPGCFGKKKCMDREIYDINFDFGFDFEGLEKLVI
jgi:hypothetical protein